MPIPEPVTPLEPWQTAWPAGLALLGLVVSTWRARAHLRPERADGPWMLSVGLLALVVRLWVLPAWSQHYFDGHEAEYWDIFRGVRPVNRGGTVLYPSMQWMWWGLGRILPHSPHVPVVLMAALGSLGCVVTGAAVGRWAGRLGAASAALMLALHPVLSAWSSSAYNVVLPWFGSAIVFWSASALAGRRSPSLPVVWMASFAWALVAATRMEAAWIAAPSLLVAVVDAPSDQPLSRRLRQCLPWMLPVGVGFGLAGAAILPLVFPGELPGAGERTLSFLINRFWTAPYAPLDGWGGGLAVVGLAALALRRRPLVVLVFVGAAGVAHGVLASFDDFGDRHTLGALFAVALVVGLSVTAPGARGRLGQGLGLLLLGVCSAGLLDMRERFYGSEERFATILREDAVWADLPRMEAEDARHGCGWIAEDPRVAPQPQHSHFNLIDPSEADAIRGPEGCLRWCLDVQDWRWSSRGVRDRALRTARLYALQPVAVVEDRSSGYACLVMELGSRRNGTSATAASSSASPSASSHWNAPRNDENDASGSLHHSRIP